MNFTIESFIKKDKKDIIKDIYNIDRDMFINVKDYNLLNIKHLDYDYLEGCILMNYNNEELLGYKEWDLIEQLWYYFINATNELLTKKSTSFQFPDQPFVVKFIKENPEYLTIILNNNHVRMEQIKFIQEILNAGEDFYNKLLLLFPTQASDISHVKTLIMNLKQKYDI